MRRFSDIIYDSILRTTVKTKTYKNKSQTMKNSPYTTKQIELIHEIEKGLHLEKDKHFTGASLEEARLWLAKYADVYRKIKRNKQSKTAV